MGAPASLERSRRLRAELAVRGVRVDAPVSRTGGAGPSGDGHLVIDGMAVAVPIDPTSPYRVVGGRLVTDPPPGSDTPAGGGVGGTESWPDVEVEAVDRPAWYDQETTDGVAMHRIARLHGADVLATTVVQTCVRYEPSQRCRYCSIEESLASGATTRVKTPGQLAEVAVAAVASGGVSQMVMTTGTAASADRGARYLARCVAAVKAAVPDLPVQVQCEPPDDPGALAALRSAGADSVGIHVESLDDEARRRWLPGKATVPLSRYWATWDEAVRLWGRNRVSTYLLIGLGEDPAQLIAGAEALIARGVYPFVVPVRPMPGTMAAEEGLLPPDATTVARIARAVGDRLAAAEMRGADQQAGCAACGGCSPLADGATPVRLGSRIAATSAVRG